MKRSVAVVLLVLAGIAGCSNAGDPVENIKRARALMAAGENGEARIRLKNALASDSKLAEARILLATITLAEGDPRGAEAELSTLGPEWVSTPDGVVLGIRVALGKNDLPLAAKRLEEGANLLTPKDAALLKADLLRRQNQTAEALLVLREIQQQMPEADDIGLEIASTLAAAGNLARAVDAVDAIIARDSPVKADALRLRAQLRLRQGSPLPAIEDLKAAVKGAPATWPRGSRIAAELMLVDAMLSAGQLPAAREQLKHVNETWPGLIGAEVQAAQIDLTEGRAAQAAERLAPLVDANPQNRRLQFMLVDALVKSGRTGRATSILEGIADKDGAESPARLMLANLYLQSGRPDRVVRLLASGIAGVDIATQDAQGKLLASARMTQQQATTRMSELAAQLRAKPDDALLKAKLAEARVMAGDIDGALSLLGAEHKGPWLAEEASARMSALLAKGSEREANTVVDQLLKDEPAPSAEVLLAAANAASRYQNPVAASRLLDKAASLKPRDRDISVRRASLAFDAKRYEDAEKYLREISQDDAAAVEVAVALARLAEAKGDISGARKQLRATITKFPDAAEGALMLASLEFRANKPDDGNAVLDQFLTGKRDGAAATSAGMLLARLARMEEARSRFRQAVDLEPTNGNYWGNLAQAQLALSDKDAALESLLKSFDLQPDSLPVAAAAVRLSLEKRDVATALRVASNVARVLPGEGGSWTLQGTAELAAGRPNDAVSSFARSWSVRPSGPAAVGEFRARLEGRAARPDAPLLKWLERDPRDLKVRRLLSDYYLGSRQPAAAEAQLEIMVKDAPNDEVTLNNLAWLLRDKQPDRAEKYAAQAVAMASSNASVADTLGLVLSGRGKHQEAEAQMARAAALAPADPTIQYHLAVVLNRAGKSSEARAPLQRALQGGIDFQGRADALKLQEEIGK